MAAGLTGAALASALWMVLATTTSLTFHLMPMSGSLAAAAAFTWRGHRSGQSGWLSITLGAALSVATAGLLAVLGRPLDAWWATALAVAAGLLVGLVWVGRQARSR